MQTYFTPPRLENQDNIAHIPLARGRVIQPGQQYQDGKDTLTAKCWLFQVVKCPYCGRRHHHGFEPGKPREVLTRQSHCDWGYVKKLGIDPYARDMVYVLSVGGGGA